MNVEVHAKVWLEIEGGVPFCHGKAALLSAIQECGSIRKATSQLRMSYRRGWEYIREIEQGVQFSVVETRIGGEHGGGARLTPRGADLLSLYETVHREVTGAITAQGAIVV